MAKKRLLYLTTNTIWGGSEVLWTLSAKRFMEEGYEVSAGAHYSISLVSRFLKNQDSFIDLNKRFRYTFTGKIFQKLGLIVYKPTDSLSILFKTDKPDLVIISQGNNTEGFQFMELCYEHQVPFVTLTHLVIEMMWPAMNDERIDRLSLLYEQSRMNFFVSRHTLGLHQKMLGINPSNSAITYNPFTKRKDIATDYPAVRDGIYKVVLFGRLENFHKGYDLLIDVLKQDKWKRRPLLFTIYGGGPHRGLIRRMIQLHEITNLIIEEHRDDVADIWKSQHILLMPSRMEGQSLTLIESMWFKRAAIVTRVGGVEELVEDGQSGFIASFPTEKHIDEALERAWESRERWKEMGETAYRLIKERHPEDAVSYFNGQIEAVIGQKLALDK